MKSIHRNAEPFSGKGKRGSLPSNSWVYRVAGRYEGFGYIFMEVWLWCFGIVTTGHGTTPEDLATKSWTDWFNAVEEEYLKLQQSYRLVIPMGLSMGGVLAMHLAAQHQVRGFVSLSAPIFLLDERVYKIDEYEFEYYVKERTPEAEAHILAEGRFSYDAIPLKALSSLLELIDLVKEELGEIKASALILQSQDDTLVNPQSAEYIYDHLGSKEKELIWLEKSGHVITLGVERQLVFERIEQFLQRGLENAV